jgi:threonylcarbamoyladenosine tRNA methylthiotransferase MtaB
VKVACELLNKKRESYLSVTDVNTADFEPMCITRAERTRAYVKIEDGCECRCTYCAIADARGRVRSKAPADVIAEVEGLSRSGVCEIVLTGIETGSYGRDFGSGYGLAELLTELDARGSARRIRLGSLAPELVGRDFIEKVKGLKILAPHFHLSVQSGSDAVLRRMKRRYTAAQALENIRLIRESIPDAAFTTDLMVGFPGETEEDFRRTVDFARKARFIDAHVFAYSRRGGTPAADYPDQVDEPTKRARSEELIGVCRELRDSVLSEIVERGEPLSVILESYDGEGYAAHADNFAEVYVPLSDSKMGGEMVKVIPVSNSDGIITAKII